MATKKQTPVEELTNEDFSELLELAENIKKKRDPSEILNRVGQVDKALSTQFEQAEQALHDTFDRIKQVKQRILEIDRTPVPAKESDRQKLFGERSLLLSELAGLPNRAAIAAQNRAKAHITLLQAQWQTAQRVETEFLAKNVISAEIQLKRAEVYEKYSRAFAKFLDMPTGETATMLKKERIAAQSHLTQVLRQHNQLIAQVKEYREILRDVYNLKSDLGEKAIDYAIKQFAQDTGEQAVKESRVQELTFEFA